MLTTRLWRWSGLRHGLRIGRPRFARSTWAIVEGTPRSSSDASGHRSASETASGRQNTPAQVADDSALRECHESRGTRYSEGHSAQNDVGRGRTITGVGGSNTGQVGALTCRVSLARMRRVDVLSRSAQPSCAWGIRAPDSRRSRGQFSHQEVLGCCELTHRARSAGRPCP